MPRGASRLDEAFVQNSLWSPAILGTNLVAWNDATDSGSLTFASGVISAWAGKGSGRLSLAQSNATFRPSYTQHAWDGRPGVTFTTDKQLTSSISLTYQCTILGVVRSSSSAGAQRWLEGAGTQRPACRIRLTNGTDTNIQTDAGGTINLGVPYTGWNVLGGIWQGTGSIGTRNGFRTTGNLSATATMTTLYISGDAGRAQPLLGDLGELLIVNRNVATWELDRMEGYLAWKWGIPLAGSHPYRNRPPVIGG